MSDEFQEAMANNSLKNIVESLNSAGYNILQIDFLYQDITPDITRKYVGDVKILLWPVSDVSNPFSKEIFIKLAEVFSSLKYGIVKYELLHKRKLGEIELILQSL